jgi:hypothetical protein
MIPDYQTLKLVLNGRVVFLYIGVLIKVSRPQPRSSDEGIANSVWGCTNKRIRPYFS